MSQYSPTYSRSWFLTAGETNAQGHMPLTLITARAIEIATLHANSLDIGYSNLCKYSLGWVLARFSIEVYRYPSINETYTMTTWIEGVNRRFSDRCFEMTDAEGNVIAVARSVWVAIDTERRCMADLDKFPTEHFPVPDNRVCPLPKCRQPAIDPEADCVTAGHVFSYTELDFNRHVNTLRYIEMVLNLYSLDYHDHNMVEAMEASFDRECHFGQHVDLVTGPSRTDAATRVTEIVADDSRRSASVALRFKPRNN